MSTKSSLEKVDVNDVNHLENGASIIQIDNIRVLGLTPDDADFYQNYPEEKRKRVIRKIDIRLIPMLAFLYLAAHIDRANIGNAKIEGLDKDLGLTSVQYNTVLSIFFVPYVLLEVPSNMLLKKFKRPSTYLGILLVSWGIIMTMTGVVKNYAGLMTTRVLLGVFEAGFFPAAVYLCSYWYMPKQLATRISYFYCASALSGAFSGMLAAAIAKMHGVGGYEGWRWIFLLEGLATVVLGVMCFFLLIDSPALSGRWLEPDEIRYLELQMFIKQGGKFHEEKKGFNWRDLKIVLCNWRLYMQAYFLLCQSATSYGTKFTLPTITKAMGFTNTNAQLMSAPPYVAGALSALFFARLSDRLYWRMPFVIIPMSMIIVGNSILLSLQGNLKNIGPAYFSILFSVMGIFPIQAAAASWNANNIAPENRRAIGVALMNCVGNMGGIVGSFMYMESEAPKYYTGFGLSVAFGASGIIVAIVLELTYKWGNAKKAKISEEEIKAKYTEAELMDMGDRSPLFRYVL